MRPLLQPIKLLGVYDLDLTRQITVYSARDSAARDNELVLHCANFHRRHLQVTFGVQIFVKRLVAILNHKLS